MALLRGILTRATCTREHVWGALYHCTHHVPLLWRSTRAEGPNAVGLALVAWALSRVANTGPSRGLAIASASGPHCMVDVPKGNRPNACGIRLPGGDGPRLPTAMYLAVLAAQMLAGVWRGVDKVRGHCHLALRAIAHHTCG